MSYQAQRMPFSAYIHIPFCEVKCGYCDFFSVPRGYEDFDLQKEYVAALVKEIHQRAADFKGRNLLSIFFGGGTPSLLQPSLVEEILKTLQKYFVWNAKTEITLETNPKTVSLEKLKDFRSLGINRLSVGVQSFQDRFLKTLGRFHNAGEARRVLEEAPRAGFQNLSCDLIFALPDQTFEEWMQDLKEALSYGTNHISAYALTIEKGTAFHELNAQGRLALPAEEEAIRCLVETRKKITESGLKPYEISNFARPGFESEHNQNYWRYGEYLGFGTSAASFTGRVRSQNTRDLKKYIKGNWEGSSEKISEETSRGEFCWLGFRTSEGVSEKAFQEKFKIALGKVYQRQLDQFQKNGWLEKRGDSWRLTEPGILFADEVGAAFL